MKPKFNVWDVVKLKHWWLPMTVENNIWDDVLCVFFSFWGKLYKEEFPVALLELTSDRLDTRLKVK